MLESAPVFFLVLLLLAVWFLAVHAACFYLAGQIKPDENEDPNRLRYR